MFPVKSWCVLTQCTLPWVFYVPLGVFFFFFFLKGRLTFGTSQSSALHASLSLPFIWHLLSSVHIWDERWHLGHLNLHASLPSAASRENRSSIIVIIFLPLLHRPSRRRRRCCRHGPSESFVPLKGNVTFSAPLSQVKNKEWRLNVERGVIEMEVRWCQEENLRKPVDYMTEILVIF